MSESGPEPVAIALDLQIKNAEKFKVYVEGAIPTMAIYGGRVLVAYDVSEHISTEFGEGRHFFAIVQWPSKEAFQSWLNSPEYKPWREIRTQGGLANIAISKLWII